MIVEEQKSYPIPLDGLDDTPNESGFPQEEYFDKLRPVHLLYKRPPFGKESCTPVYGTLRSTIREYGWGTPFFSSLLPAWCVQAMS